MGAGSRGVVADQPLGEDALVNHLPQTLDATSDARIRRGRGRAGTRLGDLDERFPSGACPLRGAGARCPRRPARLALGLLQLRAELMDVEFVGLLDEQQGMSTITWVTLALSEADDLGVGLVEPAAPPGLRAAARRVPTVFVGAVSTSSANTWPSGPDLDRELCVGHRLLLPDSPVSPLEGDSSLEPDSSPSRLVARLLAGARLLARASSDRADPSPLAGRVGGTTWSNASP